LDLLLYFYFFLVGLRVYTLSDILISKIES